MRKPLYMAVLGISIVVAAVSLGVTLTRYLGLRAFSPKGTAQAASTPAARLLPDTPPERWNNLFAPGDGMKLASRLPKGNAKTASQAPRTTFVLVGTIASSASSARRAVLWASGMKEPKSFREKDEVEPGAILSSVERDKVWITRGGEREKLEILPVGSARPTTTGSLAAAPGTPSRPGMAASPGPSPDRTPAVAITPKASPGEEDEESSTPRQRRRRAQGLRR